MFFLELKRCRSLWTPLLYHGMNQWYVHEPIYVTFSSYGTSDGQELARL